MKLKEKKKKQANNPVKAIIVAVVIIAAAAVALYFGLNAFTQNAAEERDSYSLPLITTPHINPATGEEVDVQTLFTVLIPKSQSADVTSREINDALTEIMTELDAAGIFGDNRVTYINERTTALLNERLAENEVTTEVFLTDISTDYRFPLVSPGGQSEEIRDGLFEGIE